MKTIAAGLFAVTAILPLAAQGGSVTFKAPLSGATVSGSLTGAGCEASSGGAARVEFFLDNLPLNIDVASPWNCLLDTTLFANGDHVLKAVAYDKRGKASTAQLSINVANNAAAPPPPPPPAGSTPYFGTPVAIPATIEAENFDKGGEGVAYHDNVAGNAGGQYRTSEDVDIIVSSDSAGGAYVVNNFETGEWMKYTINVPTTGNYDLALRISSAFTTSAFRVEVDGVDATGRISVPSTGSWSAFQWVTAKTGLPLTSGNHVLRIVADQQYFNFNSIRVSTPAAPPPPGTQNFFCTFANSPTDCGFREQAKVAGRATLANVGRDGGTAARLHTEPGDSDVYGSGTWERNDLTLGTSSSYCNPGQEEWWAHSVLFPDDYVFPPGPGAGIVMDFHHSGSTGQANFELQTIPTIGLRLRGYAGATVNGGQYEAEIPDPYGAPRGSVAKNRWYDFVYHIKWSANTDGFVDAWLNGRKVLTHRGPTLYAGMTCYLKLANYHAAFGQPSSVIHDRIVRGTSAGAVSLTPLEGVQ